MTTWPERAKDIADDVLFPAADAVDAEGEIPAGHVDILAAAGFYGLAASGPDGPTLTELGEIIEIFCGACLARTFTQLAARTSSACCSTYWESVGPGV